MLAAELTDVCGAKPGVICRNVFDWTDNRTAAELTDWLAHKPLKLLLIALVALVAVRLVRRAIGRSVERLVRQRSDQARVEAGPHASAPWRLERLAERTERTRQRALTFSAILQGVATAAIFTIAVLTGLSELGINLGPLIAGAGIAGLAIGFGAQTLVRDVIAGSFIVMEDQYGVGDTVDLGDARGVVERVTLRTTSVRDIEGVLWTVANGEIKRVANKSQLWARAVLDVRIAYDEDLDRAVSVIKQVADQVWHEQPDGARIVEEPVVLGVEAFADGATVVRLSVKTDPGAQFKTARVLRAELKGAFDAAGIRGLGAVAATPASPSGPANPGAGGARR